jgi:uncharacterized integral membrane protein (TIGR02327 family)
MVKISLYLLFFSISLWMIEGIKIEIIFKKNRLMQIQLLYIVLAILLSYIVVNFLYDFNSLINT